MLQTCPKLFIHLEKVQDVRYLLKDSIPSFYVFLNNLILSDFTDRQAVIQ